MAKKKQIYIAGPLFSKHERNFLENLAKDIAAITGLDPEADMFLPHRDAGDIGFYGGGRGETFASDLKHLDDASVVVALLDGPDADSGTAVELGYAYAKEKEIFGILTDWRRWSPNGKVKNINNMIWGICGKGKRIFRELDEKFSEDIKKAIKLE
jgi:nucleoside 2-deoxyribosyltransferase